MERDLQPRERAALNVLKQFRGELTRQQIKTLKGQVLSGNPGGAIKGIQEILSKKIVR